MAGGFLRGVVEDRLSGGQPGPLRAVGAALAAGAVAAVLTYRVLRGGAGS